MSKSILMIVGLIITMIISVSYINTLFISKDSANSKIEMFTKDKSNMDLVDYEADPLFTKYDIALSGLILDDSKYIKIDGNVINVNNTKELMLQTESISSNKKYYSFVEYEDEKDSLIMKFVD